MHRQYCRYLADEFRKGRHKKLPSCYYRPGKLRLKQCIHDRNLRFVTDEDPSLTGIVSSNRNSLVPRPFPTRVIILQDLKNIKDVGDDRAAGAGPAAAGTRAKMPYELRRVVQLLLQK